MEMELKLGARIAALRKAKGMTQEALARALGVTAAAVSKWETDASCPDIALLCPLARALGTNVDTLLAFERSISHEQIGGIMAQIVQAARAGDLMGAQAQIDGALHAYPGNGNLKLNLAAAYDVLAVSAPDAPQLEAWQAAKRALYEAVHADGTDAQRQAAASALASIALREDRLGDVQTYLDEIPDHHEETIIQRVQLCQKRGEKEKAREAVQKKLYACIAQANTCLMLLADVQSDPADALAAVNAAQALEEVFGVGGGYSAGLQMQQHLKMGQREEALICLNRLVDALLGPTMEPTTALFCPGVVVKYPQSQAPREIRESILCSMETDREFVLLREEAAYRSAVSRLRASLEHAQEA